MIYVLIVFAPLIILLIYIVGVFGGICCDGISKLKSSYKEFTRLNSSTPVCTYDGEANFYFDEELEEIETEDNIFKNERVENYDKQIDGYTQLVKMLDKQLLEERDDKKKSAILSKQILTLEKLNKTIEKREKLDR